MEQKKTEQEPEEGEEGGKEKRVHTKKRVFLFEHLELQQLHILIAYLHTRRTMCFSSTL